MLDIENIIVKTDKDVYNVRDLQKITGLSQNTCYRLIHSIKSVSDVLCVAGVVHRVDYIAYLRNQYRNRVHTIDDKTYVCDKSDLSDDTEGDFESDGE